MGGDSCPEIRGGLESGGKRDHGGGRCRHEVAKTVLGMVVHGVEEGRYHRLFLVES